MTDASESCDMCNPVGCWVRIASKDEGAITFLVDAECGASQLGAGSQLPAVGHARESLIPSLSQTSLMVELRG